jgi:hypothetical protein
MAFTTPGTAVAGEVLTAAFWNEQVRDNILMGNPVFTNEAARDAVITAPVEGQRAYLTAPTVPAATGASTFLPTGIQTIYNGSVWVCVTPVSAFTAAGGTTTSTSFTATLGGSPGTNPSVTLVTGTTALVHLRATLNNSNAAAYSFASVSINGSTPVDDFSLFVQIGTQLSVGTSILFSGLTAGTNTFVMQYSVNTGTGTFQRRGVTVTGIA